MTRTEVFLKYAEENPDEVLGVIEEKTESLIRDLEARLRDVARPSQKDTSRWRRRAGKSPAAVSDVPF
jgi:hypothetical protein